MKNPHKKIILFTLVLSAILFGKCSLLEQDINGDLSSIIPVSELKNDVNIPYSSTSIISADSDDDIKDNLDKIKDWTVTEVSYSIMGFKGDQSTTFSGSLGFSKRSASSASITTSVSSVNLADVSDNGIKYKLSLSETQLNTIAGYFDADQAIKIYLDGVLSQGPATFDVKVYAKVKIKAKIL